MPYCTQCGTVVETTDRFCPTCGTAQAGQSSGSARGSNDPFAGAAKVANDVVSGLSPQTASVLCYVPIVGWIASIIVLASERYREDRDVRFHAFQGLYLFVVWLFVDWVFSPMTDFVEATRYIGKILKVTVFGTWIFMLVKTSQHQLFRLPILGDLADRSVSEQK